MDFRAIHRCLRFALLVLAVVWVVSFFSKGRFIGHEEADALLSEEPAQIPTDREAFEFVYKEKVCRVRPVAEYDLRGLVVSHNNIESLADMVHDSTSVDTKDLCVIWGANLADDNFHDVDFKSGQFTCYFSYPGGVKFRHHALSNNHLITDSDEIRDAIGRVRIGDQVRLTGMIVDYQMDDWGKFWRRTSETRKDTGCEVVFVETLEILQKGTPGWYAAHTWAGRGLVLGLLLVLALLILEVLPGVHPPPRT